MAHRNIISQYLAWTEGSLSAGERRKIEQHLHECNECRSYYEKLSRLLERPAPAPVPGLRADPYLPARIRASAASARARASTASARARDDARRGLGWTRVAFSGAAFLLALVAGVYLGKGISTDFGENDEAYVAQAYYEAFSPSDFSKGWASIVSEPASNGEEGSDR
jgi:predicted anti-sigma-YlaC factor YlaD